VEPLLPDDVFVKSDPHAPAGFFEAEARGLRWLAEADGGVPVARVRSVGATRLVLERLRTDSPTPARADALGEQLARTHLAGASCWGHPDGDGYVGPLPLPNGPFDTWGELWWCGRVEPYLRMAVDAGRLPREVADEVEATVHRLEPSVPVAGPCRLHGDLWSGNVVWTPSGAVLVDAGAAHGGHPEADLAMLALFGLPYLDRVLDAYQQTNPLPDGWRQRVSLFWLHPLLVHVVLFGGGYVQQVRQALRCYRLPA
jgi:fructosamine-3-kinase